MLVFSLAFKYHVIISIIHRKQNIIATLSASATTIEQPIYFYLNDFLAKNHLDIYVVLLTRKRSNFEFCYQFFSEDQYAIPGLYSLCRVFSGEFLKENRFSIV